MLELLLSNNFLSSIIAFAIILIPAIIIHELGHFVAAKMVGISVLEFGVGFPPRMTRLFMWGETEFTLNWLPIGGFVRPLGEDMIGPVIEEDTNTYDGFDDDDDKPKNTAYISEREELMARGVPEHKLQSVNETKPWSRIWFMVAGAVFNVVSAVIFFIFAALTGLPTFMGETLLLTNIPTSSVFQQEQVYQFDTVERINGAYFETFGDFFTAVSSSDAPVELTMRHTRNIENIETATREVFESYTIIINPDVFAVQPYVYINSIIEDSPATDAGLQLEDRIVSVNGLNLDVSNPLQTVIDETNENAGSSISLVVLRGTETFTVNVESRLDPPPRQGRIGIGISALWQTSDGTEYGIANPQIKYIPQDIGTSITYGFGETGRVLSLIAQIPGQIIDGTISGEEARPVSIVGISQIGGQFLQNSVRNNAPYEVLTFIALISIFLGITNLLPFPPLDGGRILFVLIEIVRGKPVPPNVENAIYRIGIALLLILGVIVIIFDIVNPINLG
ncbi:MAG: RIP metalloprotease RseP [Phototrophicaceae bacterium]